MARSRLNQQFWNHHVNLMREEMSCKIEVNTRSTLGLVGMSYLADCTGILIHMSISDTGRLFEHS